MDNMDNMFNSFLFVCLFRIIIIQKRLNHLDSDI